MQTMGGKMIKTKTVVRETIRHINRDIKEAKSSIKMDQKELVKLKSLLKRQIMINTLQNCFENGLINFYIETIRLENNLTEEEAVSIKYSNYQLNVLR